MILTVVLYTFVVFTTIQILYYLTFSLFLFKQKKEIKIAEQVPVSVIIFAKNSASELQNKLSFVLKQNYPTFEVVLINNVSIDNTSEILEDYKEKHANIKIIDVENTEAFWASKKYALTLGIKAAKYNHLLFTEANAKPVSEFWISEMIHKFTTTKSIILGYSKYKKEGSLTNIFIRFVNLLTAIKCFTFAKSGTPFMGFKANLAYNKSDFFKVNGFINHLKINNGETDLFLKDAATKQNITYTIEKDSFIEIENPKSFKSWLSEYRENSLLMKNYKLKHRFLLSFFNLSKLIFYVLTIFLFFFYSWKTIVPFVLSYFLVQYVVIGLSAKKLKEPYLIFLLPFLEISLLLIQISIFIANFISKPNR